MGPCWLSVLCTVVCICVYNPLNNLSLSGDDDEMWELRAYVSVAG